MTTQSIYGYYINLNERGDFQADVRNVDGDTIFEIRAGSSLDDDEISIFEDGFMRHPNDISGLEDYLRYLGILDKDARLMGMCDFERYLEQPKDEFEDEPDMG